MELKLFKKKSIFSTSSKLKFSSNLTFCLSRKDDCSRHCSSFLIELKSRSSICDFVLSTSFFCSEFITITSFVVIGGSLFLQVILTCSGGLVVVFVFLARLFLRAISYQDYWEGGNLANKQIQLDYNIIGYNLGHKLVRQLEKHVEMSEKKKDNLPKYIDEPIKTVDGEIALKRYLIVKQVGSGSYSKCYLVQNQNSDSFYVVKVIPKNKLEILSKEKLIYEIKIHQSLSHPNVVHLDHWFEDDDNQYIFMEYCSQGNLEMILNSVDKFTENDLKYYGRQAIEGIAYIHSQNILHRDLKLCNFYIDQNYKVKLGDFGFACQLASANQKKRETCGTPNYIAPEAISGFGYSFSSDVWSIGVMLYRLKYRCCPFEALTVKETLENVKLCKYKFPKSTKISAELKDLISKIFNINYDERLTVEQILSHPFFEGSDQLLLEKSKQYSKKKDEKKFSLKKIFSLQKDKKPHKNQQKAEKSPRQPSRMESLRSNSCQTFKQIKEIFKSKSKPTLSTSQQYKTELNTFNQTYSTLHTINFSHRDKEQKTHRKNLEYSFNPSIAPKKEEPTRANKLNEFIKSQVSKNDQGIKRVPRNSHLIEPTKQNQQLLFCTKRYYLPSKIQTEKDITIIHYKESIKQIIYQGKAYLVHRKGDNVYSMKGEPVSIEKLPKLLKYILENKLEVREFEEGEEDFDEITVKSILPSVGRSWMETKEGIILRYGRDESFLLGKYFSQEPFYVYEEEKICFMYNVVDRVYKVFEGAVILRIYTGWLKHLLKK